MKKFILNKKESTGKSVGGLLKSLLDKGVVKYLLYPRMQNDKDVAFQCFTDSVDTFEDNGIFIPVMPVNSAKVISDFSFKNFKDKVGVVIRPCEAKAVIELIKLKQIDRDDIMIITFDCLGIVDPKDFKQEAQGYKDIEKLREENIAKYANGGTVFEEKLRKSCQVCDIPVYDGDLNIGVVGLDNEISITVKDEIYENIKEALTDQLQEKNIEKRDEVLGDIVKKKTLLRDKIIKEFRDKVNSLDELLKLFSTCMRCYNCRAACPICYCRECIFDTKVFEYAPSTFKKWLEKKGAVKVPLDTLLFHLTRLNHMSFSCINCGYCSSACPNGLPVFELFLSVGSDVKKLFDYVPGMSLEEPIVLTEFKENELEEIES